MFVGKEDVTERSRRMTVLNCKTGHRFLFANFLDRGEGVSYVFPKCLPETEHYNIFVVCKSSLV